MPEAGARRRCGLHRSRMRLQNERPTIRVDHGVTLAAFDLLAGVEAARTAAFRGFHRLAVDHGGRRTGLAFDALAIEHHQTMVQALPQAVVAKADEPAIGRLVRRKMLGQQPPRTAAAQHIENRVQHFAHRPMAMATRLGGRRQKRRKNPPFLVAQIAAITQMVAVMPRPCLRRPHRRLQEEMNFSTDFDRFAKIQQPTLRFETAS